MVARPVREVSYRRVGSREGVLDTVVTPAGHAAALWAGLLLLLLLALSILTVRQRQRTGIVIGDGEHEPLVKAMRAFGNAAEYIPAGVGALALLAIVGAPWWLIHVVGLLLFVGRIVHAVALSRNLDVSLGRTVGMILTWLAVLVSAAVLLFYSAP